MTGAPLVELDHVWKRYLLGSRAGAREALLSLLLPGHADRTQLWPLQDLSLAVGPGESVGLIGHNGAGKTTTLKLLAGITRPTRGRVRTRGRIASLINVGAGFHRELTGRQNVYLNGVILGLTRREIDRRYDEIVEFAGLAPFMDTPVKHYSSGMYARLAFAVAVHVDPEILLVDEVLSVGDAAFQDRSLRRMLAFRDSGAAVLFVSHNLSAVELMCQRAVWLDHGKARAVGRTSDVIRAYLDALDDVDSGESADQRYMSVESLEVLNEAGEATERIDSCEPFVVRIQGRAHQPLLEPAFVLSVRGDEGPLFAGNMLVDGNWPQEIPVGPFRLDCAFGSARLVPGTYRVELKVKQNVRTNYFEPRVLARVVVSGRATGAEPGGAVEAHWRWVSGERDGRDRFPTPRSPGARDDREPSHREGDVV